MLVRVGENGSHQLACVTHSIYQRDEEDDAHPG